MPKSKEEFQTEIDGLRIRLEEAEDTLRAIGSGEVDAFVVSGPDGEQVFTLKGAEQPYRILVETMSEGAATLSADGTILYCNKRLADLLKVSQEALVGTSLGSYIATPDQPMYDALLHECVLGYVTSEMTMITGTGNTVPVFFSCCAHDFPGTTGLSVVITDLTQQKRNEAILASEKFSTSIVELASEAMVVCDTKGKVIRASQSAHDLCGTNPLLKPFGKMFPLQFTESGKLFSLSALMRKGHMKSIEVKFTRNDGQLFNLLLNATDFRSHQTQDIGSIVTLTDITGRKQMENALQQSELRLRIAYSHLQVVNEELLISNEELQAQSEELQAQSEELQAQSEELHGLHAELEARVKERTVALAASIESLQQEIAERAKTEQRLFRLNQLYAVLSETNQSIVKVTDSTMLFSDFCRIAVEHGGFLLSWVGLLDEKTGEVRRIAAYGKSAYLDNIRITAADEPDGEGPTGIAIRNGAYYICNDFQNDPCTRPWHERGKAYGINASAAVALKEGNRVIGVLTLYSGEKNYFDRQQVELLQQMGMDISYALDNFNREECRKDAEQALYLEATERLKTVEVLREKEQMLIQQSRQAAMGEMIGNIAHQWRQPLNTLGLYTQSLGIFYGLPRFNKDFLDDSIAKSMEIIQHMSKTIDDFRDYFRPEKEKTDFYVIEAINSTLSLMEGNFQHPKITIDFVEHDNPVINGYQNEFAQVFLNILNNARDAMIEREIADGRITITTWSENSCVVVTVADNAGGIPDEVIDKIFDPYFTTKGPQLGTGIGLFMSKTIIEKNMGGRLTVRNSDTGAEFRIEVEHGTQN